MRSLRARVLTAAAIGTLLVLSLSWMALYMLLRDSLYGEFDGLLGDRVRSLAALVEQDGTKIDLEFDEEGRLAEFRSSDRPAYYQAWLAGGTVLGRSQSLGGGDLASISGPDGSPAYRSLLLPDGRPGRMVGISFHPRTESMEGPVDGREGDEEAIAASSRPLVTLVVARETAEIDRTLAGLRAILVAVGSLATLVCLGVLALVVRRGFRPVDHIAGQIRQVGEDDLSARIDLAGLPRELAPVGERLNELLARLETAFERERSFSADVSHELRTPLAGLRATLEVALAAERDPVSDAQAMADCLSICHQTQAMVENLLSLARLEAGQSAVERELVDLEKLLQECWKPLADRARERGLSADWKVEEGLTLDTDSGKLRLVLRNLLDNAVSHADAGGRVTVEAVSREQRVELRITNSGSRLSPLSVDRAFERFWRGDAARESTGIHCGLGLCLSEKLVDLLEGTIALESEEGGDFGVFLELSSLPGSGQRAANRPVGR
jgi:two-component system sensor histidine kinase QseC